MTGTVQNVTRPLGQGIRRQFERHAPVKLGLCAHQNRRGDKDHGSCQDSPSHPGAQAFGFPRSSDHLRRRRLPGCESSREWITSRKRSLYQSHR
jgi:hypothetical protein